MSNATTRNVNTVFNAYMSAWNWTDNDNDENPLELDDTVLDMVYRDIRSFLAQIDAYDTSDWDDEQLGHDLLLTRNGHGTGFWDRGRGMVGDILSGIATEMGPVHM